MEFFISKSVEGEDLEELPRIDYVRTYHQQTIILKLICVPYMNDLGYSRAMLMNKFKTGPTKQLVVTRNKFDLHSGYSNSIYWFAPWQNCR